MKNQYEEMERFAKKMWTTHDISKEKAIEIATTIQRNAIEKERNEIFNKAFTVGGNGPQPLEAIAMVLGYSPHGRTIIDAIDNR